MTGIPVVKGNQGFSLTPTVERGVDAAVEDGRASGESAAGKVLAWYDPTTGEVFTHKDEANVGAVVWPLGVVK